MGPRTIRRVIAAAVVITVSALIALTPLASAAEEPVCTDTWTATSGHWSETAHWSAGHTPTSADVACIPMGKQTELVFSEETGETGVLSGAGTVKIDSGQLKIENALQPSDIATLKMDGSSGVLTGAATLDVTSALNWTQGTMSGSGSTVVQAGVSGTLAGGLTHRTFVNKGSLTDESELFLKEGAQFNNKGSVTVNLQTEGPMAGNYAIAGESGTALVNAGKLRHTEGTGFTHIELPFTNEGTIEVLSGTLQFRGRASSTSTATWTATEGEKPAHIELLGNFVTEEGSYIFNGGTVTGHVNFGGSSDTLTTTGVNLTAATLHTATAKWQVPSGTETVAGLEMPGGVLEGAGTLRISGRLEFTSNAKMVGTGQTIVEHGVAGHLGGAIERSLVNEGQLTTPESELFLGKGGYIENDGVLTDNYEVSFSIGVGSKDESIGIANYGVFQRSACGVNKCTSERPAVEPLFVNHGWILEKGGPVYFKRLVQRGHAGWGCTRENPSYPKREYAEEEGVCTATGDLSETQTDLKVAGKGLGLDVTRTYNSQVAEKESKAGKPGGMFGYGWSSPYSAHVVARSEYTGTESEFEAGEPPAEAHYLTLFQGNGATIEFFESAPGVWRAPPGSPDVATGSSSSGYTIKLENQQTYTFSGAAGRLESESDRFGNVTHLKYNAEGRLETVEDPGKRLLKFGPYNAEGLVETIEDPMGHRLAYHYTAGKLTEVSELGEPEKPRWKFEYEGEAQLKQIENAIGGKTKVTYASGRVATKTDPIGHVLMYEYLPGQSTITNEATKAVTIQYTTSDGTLAAVSHGVGTTLATTESFTYSKTGERTSKTDGRGNATRYEYDANGNKTLEEDPEGHVRKWTYDAKHDVESEETPDKELTTYVLEPSGNGNIKEVKRAAPESKTQTTKYTYNAAGQVKTATNPLAKTTTFEYDSYGDKNEETDPEGDKRTWVSNADSQVEKEVSPRGHVPGETEANYTTTTRRYPTGLVEEVSAPIKHTTKYKYDGDGNRTEAIDEGHVTKQLYTAAD